jgi:hypothetical protein
LGAHSLKKLTEKEDVIKEENATAAGIELRFQ